MNYDRVTFIAKYITIYMRTNVLSSIGGSLNADTHRHNSHCDMMGYV